jgi:hypothetical protein
MDFRNLKGKIMKRISIIVMGIALAFLLTNCKSNKIAERHEEQIDKPWARNVLINPDIQYFPFETFKKQDSVTVDSAAYKYYRNVLFDARLFHFERGFKGFERYRVIMNDPEMDIVILEFQQRKAEMELKWIVMEREKDSVSNRRNFYKFKTLDLESKEWVKIQQLMSETDFFNQPTNLYSKEEAKLLSKPDSNVEWVIEGDKDKNYHIIKRRYLKKRDPFMKALKYVFSLTDIEKEF